MKRLYSIQNEYSDPSEYVELHRELLVQRRPNHSVKFRRVRRKQLAEIFAKLPRVNRGILTDANLQNVKHVAGNWSDIPSMWAKNFWAVLNFSEMDYLYPGQLWIGCVHFDQKTADIIRNWALAKPRKKVAARKKSLTASKKRAIKGSR